jgi:hypothetical protein
MRVEAPLLGSASLEHCWSNKCQFVLSKVGARRRTDLPQRRYKIIARIYCFYVAKRELMGCGWWCVVDVSIKVAVEVGAAR